MRKALFAIVVAMVLLSVDASAQRSGAGRKVGAFEVEVGVGLATAATNMTEFGKSREGVDANVELRYNLADKPIDVGIYFALCQIYRSEQVNDIAKRYSFVSENLLLTSDYNFFQGRKVSPFVGAGLGVSWSEINADGTLNGAHFAVMPRVGVELAHHLRVTLAYKVFDRANNHLVISLGYAFGGGKR